jgi:quercetin dioxygenase-like cupin family protein
MIGKRGFVSCAICAAVGLVAAGGKARAQAQPGFTRKVLQKTEYPGDRYVCILMEIEIDANALVPRHTHPGVESGYIVSGSSTLSVSGQPDRVVHAGEGFQIPPEVPHSVRNGPTKSRVVATYIVEKDKPLASPAPG